MSRIIYKTGNLFEQKGENKVLVHSCNCKGVWGSGIAVGFRENFPFAHSDYKRLCSKNNKQLLGLGIHHFMPVSNEQRVGYLFTSFGYGEFKDNEETILRNTENAVHCLLALTPEDMEIHSPKINSGAFQVPWEKTANIINKALDGKRHSWTVWNLPKK